MSFLAPGFFLAALVMAGAVTLFHFIVTRQPPSGPLPTARFVPAARVEVTTLARRPEDLLLLLLRVLAMLLIGAAFARPVITPGHQSVARIVLADLSRDVRSLAEVRDSVKAIRGDRLFGFDSVVRRLDPGTEAWTSPATGGDQGGRLSTALVAGLRAGADLRSSADSIELIVVSPLAPEEWDASTLAIRALWPGRIRLLRVRGSRDTLARPLSIALRGGTDDPIAVAIEAAGFSRSDSLVLLARDPTTAADSQWAMLGGTLIRWPAEGLPPGWTARPARDTAGAVLAGNSVVIFPFERRGQPGAGSGSVIARWVDGQPAATERKVGAGCIREVSIPVPVRGDLVLRSDFARLLIQLTRPCGQSGGAPVTATDLQQLAGSGPLASRQTLLPPILRVTPIVPWLLGSALLLLLLEPLLRRRQRSEAA